MLAERLLKHTAGIALLMGGWACSAQQATIPIAQIQQDTQLSAELMAPSSDPSSVFSSEPAAANPTSATRVHLALPAEILPSNPAPSVLPSPTLASSVFTKPTAAMFTSSIRKGGQSRTLDAHYFLLNSVHLELAILDIAMTRRCIDDHRCQEGNPLMPSSLGGQLGVGFALVGSGAVSSYLLKKHHSGFWWISPVMGIAAHSVGLASGIAHQ